MTEWYVFVRGIGYIGTVYEETEAEARLAARIRFAALGARKHSDDEVIFEDDEFSVERL